MGQIKNIKLHIVTDIKSLILSLTYTPSLQMWLSKVIQRCSTSTMRGLPSHLIPTRITGTPTMRTMSSTSRPESELRIENILKEHLAVSECEVRDISGGCGASYEVFVCAEDFRGKRMLQQHRLVQHILKDEMKDIHALRINTEVPKGET